MIDKKKCKLLLDLPGLAPGWGCCECKTYNGIQWEQCKYCSHERCDGSVITLIDSPDPSDKSKLN